MKDGKDKLTFRSQFPATVGSIIRKIWYKNHHINDVPWHIKSKQSKLSISLRYIHFIGIFIIWHISQSHKIQRRGYHIVNLISIISIHLGFFGGCMGNRQDVYVEVRFTTWYWRCYLLGRKEQLFGTNGCWHRMPGSFQLCIQFNVKSFFTKIH